ncbi:MAG TPA: DUF362 domain-containing protein [Planctomycetota bacterium]|nr:DUF362 domain-containing protein [Planctomycetota bacterium]
MKDLNRRQFLKSLSVLGVGVATSNYLKVRGQDQKPDDAKKSAEGGSASGGKPEPKPMVAVVEGNKPAEITLAALGILGGIDKFVKKDSVVVLKPNIAWEKPMELAATTNPEIVLTVAKECFKAGAKKVKIVERVCNDPKKCFQICGFENTFQKSGVEFVLLTNDPKEYKEVKIPNGKELQSILIAKDVLECDTFINIPIAKHHATAKLTLGIKNLMGIVGVDRRLLHHNLGQKMADILSAIKPHLTIIDAYRVLVRNGPTGGNPKDVAAVRKVIASVDTVAADSYACTLKPFSLEGKNVSCVQAAYDMGLGEMNLDKIDIVEKKL